MSVPHAGVIMAIMNVTPDSFSDGGMIDSVGAARERARALTDDGADLIDVGGESTRPGAVRVDPAVEARRVVPVIEALTADGHSVSVDTYNATTARAAIGAGARVVNDVTGGRADPAVFDVVADTGVEYVLGHWRAHADVMNSHAVYADVVGEVVTELIEQRDRAVAAGIAAERIILDPGLGFAKESAHNWAVLGGLDRIVDLGHRVLVGASRKRFITELLPDDHRDIEARDLPSAVVNAMAVSHGAWGVRTHAVDHTATALRALAAWQAGSRGHI